MRLFAPRRATPPAPQSPSYGLTWNRPTTTFTEKVSESIADAEALVPAETATPDPIVHLQQAVRLSPTQYRDGARGVHEHFRAGRVVILDLTSVEERTALRFVDFSIGLILGSRGTFFQVSSTVILLTPRATAD
ncbi:cell division protein SepF [Alloactinosynnema sp. L-07]|uniref:cell division protein SepF n=1 Tax=Alloactinosynnema sp. L-07 TaxID=1653480 RepID=UPI00350FD93B